MMLEGVKKRKEERGVIFIVALLITSAMLVLLCVICNGLERILVIVAPDFPWRVS